MSKKTAFMPAKQIDMSDPKFRFARSMMLLSRRWKWRFDQKMGDIDQTQSTSTALFWIAASPDNINQSELAKRIGIRMPTLTRLLISLEQQGLIVRDISQDDRRNRQIKLSEEGKEKLEKIHLAGSEIVDDILGDIDPERLETSISVLEEIYGKLTR